MQLFTTDNLSTQAIASLMGSQLRKVELGEG